MSGGGVFDIHGNLVGVLAGGTEICDQNICPKIQGDKSIIIQISLKCKSERPSYKDSRFTSCMYFLEKVFKKKKN